MPDLLRGLLLTVALCDIIEIPITMCYVPADGISLLVYFVTMSSVPDAPPSVRELPRSMPDIVLQQVAVSRVPDRTSALLILSELLRSMPDALITTIDVRGRLRKQ